MAYSRHNLSDTIVALATPAGIGAIAVIRLSGADAIDIADSVFRGKNLKKQASHTLHFGTIYTEDAVDSFAPPRLIDEVLVSVFIAPRSYTRENTIEISTHGSPYIIQQIMQLLVEKGARMAQPGEFTLRAFLNGQLDLSQAEAVADLIAANSEAAHTVAIQQLRGGIGLEIGKLRTELINFASLIELELDFSEEDVEFANRTDLEDLVRRILNLTTNLIDSFALGNAIKTGISTVIAGRPNAGKSTLLNALLQEERAIVSEIAGTTRDTIEEVLNIRGIEFRLVDTAGIREATDQIEALGVQRTLEKVSTSAILIYVFDVLETKIDEVLTDVAQLNRPDLKLLVLCNKMDENPYFRPEWLTTPALILPPNNADSATLIPDFYFKNPDERAALVPLEAAQVLTISAKKSMNVPYLKEKLFDLVAQGKLDVQSNVVSNARHFEALQNSRNNLERVLDGLKTGISADLIALDIRRALHNLGEITGDISTDDLLENIFSKFCIGK
jgi:tRNA modification GTPase